MSRDARAYLWDAQDAAKAIMEFVAGIDLETYTRTAVIHAAVERKIRDHRRGPQPIDQDRSRLGGSHP
jgi:hypothetical protein